MDDANPSNPQPESMDAATDTLQAAIAGYIAAAISQGVSPINAVHIVLDHIHTAVRSTLDELQITAPQFQPGEASCMICETGAPHACPDCQRTYCRLCWGFHICLEPR